jgi:hypothetical protein
MKLSEFIKPSGTCNTHGGDQKIKKYSWKTKREENVLESEA